MRNQKYSYIIKIELILCKCSLEVGFKHFKLFVYVEQLSFSFGKHCNLQLEKYGIFFSLYEDCFYIGVIDCFNILIYIYINNCK